MTKQIIPLFSALLVTVALAQPPEELPPPPPETEGTAPLDLPEAAPTPAAAPQKVPVAEPLAPPAAPPASKNAGGLEISPSIGVYPIGFDSVNIGDGNRREGGRYFFDLKPTLGLSMPIHTSKGREMKLSLEYSLDWREYYNKDTTERDFTHDLGGGLSIAWTPRIKTDFNSFFEYFFKSGTDVNEDNTIYFETTPSLWITAVEGLKFKIGYMLYFVNAIDSPVRPDGLDSMTDPPSDVDDFRRGSSGADATGYGGYDPSGFGLFPNSSAVTSDVPTESLWINWHAAVFGLNFAPIEGTSLGFDWRFLFAGYSNNDNAAYTGHYLIPSISQALPWKGGSISLKEELRLRKYAFATVATTGAPRQNFRNRLTLSLSQAINDSLTFEGYYRFQLTGENRDDYQDLEDNHHIYTGVSFAF